jgi:hypothetical protein
MQYKFLPVGGGGVIKPDYNAFIVMSYLKEAMK